MKMPMRRKRLPLLLMISIAWIFISADCGDSPSIGYNYIALPWLSESDQLTRLNDQDHAKVYNALCELNSSGRIMDEMIRSDTLVSARQKDTLKLIWNKAYELVNDKDPWLSSSAILFLGNFQYQRQAFLERILKNESKSRDVQLEICHILSKDTTKNQNLLRKKILFLRQSDDWLIRNSAYTVTNSYDTCASDIFLADYLAARDRDVRLLALDALKNHVPDTVKFILAHQWDNTSDKEEKEKVLDAMFMAGDFNFLSQWAEAHPVAWMSSIPELISNLDDKDSSGFYGRLIVYALHQGWKPSAVPADFTNLHFHGEAKLYHKLLEDKHKLNNHPDSVTYTVNDQLVVAALISDPVLNKEWNEYQFQMEKTSLPKQCIAEYDRLTLEYQQRTLELLQRYTSDSEFLNHYGIDTNNTRNSLSMVKLPKKTMK